MHEAVYLVLGKTGAGLQAYADTTHVANLFVETTPGNQRERGASELPAREAGRRQATGRPAAGPKNRLRVPAPGRG